MNSLFDSIGETGFHRGFDRIHGGIAGRFAEAAGISV
ncbi:hypothetical protein BKA07_001160 [Brevibacterium marinum]|uniref:Uncharacterized protein n=1 Tax=Brevibacterium marinum TaxID=418643 RepID=A0A846RXG9_9MICO|nr:hypothetical protein [Brevibacterium marinum]